MIPISQLLLTQDMEYRKNVPAHYSQSASLVRFLVEKKGPEKFYDFVGYASNSDYGVMKAITSHYGYQTPNNLYMEWRTWFRRQPRAHRNGRSRLCIGGT